jgi:hypothetical protein
MLDRGQWPSESWNPSSLATISQERRLALVGPPPWHPRPLIESAGEEDLMSRRCFDAAWTEFSRRAARATANGDPSEVRYYAVKHLDTWVLDDDELPPFELIALLRDPRDTYASIKAFNRMRGTEGSGAPASAPTASTSTS